MSSDEDYYGSDYEDGETQAFDDDSEDDEDYGLGSAVYDEELTFRPRQPRFSVLSEGDILQRQAEAVQDVATVLSVDETDAAILLRHFKWSVSQVNDEWFHNEEKVRQAVGLLSLDDSVPSTSSGSSDVKGLAASLAPSQDQKHQAPSLSPKESGDSQTDEELTCGICFESLPLSVLKPASCQQHFFCEACWEGYVSTAIADGPGCLHMRCPDPECSAAVKEKFVLSLAPEGTTLGAKYKKYLVRSYVDDNRNAKWCPAPGCEYAVEFFPDSSNYDVECKCSYKFCWNCNEEAHRPVDCETVSKWILKNSAESENMNWILAHSKACPKCKRPIEKNLGCMHMTCTPPCKHEFCWLCLGAWSEHGEKTGGFYACNRYEAARHKGLYDEAERRKEMAHNSLEKYTHYYERWAANEQSRVKAMESLREMQSTKIEVLSERQSQPVSQLKFVTEAWLQIVECRRILKWTYAYGYYLPWDDQAKKQFFEYLQGEADTALENLHRMAEKELALYIDGYSSEGEDPAKPERPFSEFKSHLAGLTSVTHTYFENLVRALENGLTDVEAREPAHDLTQRGQHHQSSTLKKDKRPGGGASAVLATSQTTAANTSSAQGAMGAGATGPAAGAAAPSRSSGGGAMARFARVAVRGNRGASGASGVASSGSAGGRAQTTRQAQSRTQGGQSNPQGLQAMHSSTSRRQDESLGYWSCEHCTFANQEGSHVCSMCNLPRTGAR